MLPVDRPHAVFAANCRLYREYSTNRDYVNPVDNHVLTIMIPRDELGGAKAFPSGCQIANLKWQM
jgi:hypothetical protein